MSKLGDPVAPQSFIDLAYADQKKALTREQEEVTDPEDRYILEKVSNMIDTICKEQFSTSFTHHDALPSLRACYENKLSEVGALGELLKDFHIPLMVDSDCLFGMTYSPRDGVSEIRFIDGDETVSQFQDYVDTLWVKRIEDRLDATPSPILEPLKVRMITKGQAAEYYRTIELQKFMHGRLRSHPIFQYIGQPIDDKSWARCFGTREELPKDSFYVSGDYKAATDNLRPSLSLKAWSSICSYATTFWGGEKVRLIDTPYYLLGSKALCSHRLHYPNDVTVDQTWGQLMGSPMSFPILCIVNAAASLVALGWAFKKNVTMKVNGDDIGFIADGEQYRTWKSVTQVCGLEFSIGKNYTSREFLLMNSELRRPPKKGMAVHYEIGSLEGCPDSDDDPWYCTITWKESVKPWKLEGFLNQCILYHRIKKGVDAGQEKDVLWPDLESLSYEALRGIPLRDQSKVLSIFLKSHVSVLQELPHMCNLFFPKALGGAGVAIPHGKTLASLTSKLDPELLNKQRLQAAYLACNTSKRLQRICRPKPVIGEVGEAFRDILSLSDRQIKPALRNKPLRREQKTMVGGKTFLGYIARSLGGHKCSGGDLASRTSSTHSKEALYLIQRYRNWLRNSLKHSLSPMGLDHISGFQEHLESFSYIEILSDRASGRGLDSINDNLWLRA
jgi:hypothetical protein